MFDVPLDHFWSSYHSSVSVTTYLLLLFRCSLKPIKIANPVKPNTLRQAELDLTPRRNISAICLIIGVILSYILLMIFFRFLDNHDLKFLSSIPLCGQDGPFSYEITIKTGMGWTAGTTANVGIRLYGTEEKSGSRHLRQLYQTQFRFISNKVHLFNRFYKSTKS